MNGIQEINASQLSDMIGNGAESFRLIDVRSANEMAQGMLPGAEAMPMHLVPLRLEALRQPGKIVFYCRTGARSAQVCAFLQQQGVDHAINLQGGIVDWYRQGYPIESPEAGVVAAAR
ncbi:rhodanese-related sulfurtransferase [Thiogranum longum]|uniref:Rhodanese-related sulfurtransferase n=2 Tax=Thiogranum longum TaxID=1537524 RepID=A0A4R1HJK5_9GAMM|nr:rhodanese-related sulfurtransferase [Thiogranum longum]